MTGRLGRGNDERLVPHPGAIVPIRPGHSLSRHYPAGSVFVRFAIDAEQGEWLALEAFQEVALRGTCAMQGPHHEPQKTSTTTLPL